MKRVYDRFGPFGRNIVVEVTKKGEILVYTRYPRDKKRRRSGVRISMHYGVGMQIEPIHKHGQLNKFPDTGQRIHVV